MCVCLHTLLRRCRHHFQLTVNSHPYVSTHMRPVSLAALLVALDGKCVSCHCVQHAGWLQDTQRYVSSCGEVAQSQQQHRHLGHTDTTTTTTATTSSTLTTTVHQAPCKLSSHLHHIIHDRFSNTSACCGCQEAAACSPKRPGSPLSPSLFATHTIRHTDTYWRAHGVCSTVELETTTSGSHTLLTTVNMHSQARNNLLNYL